MNRDLVLRSASGRLSLRLDRHQLAIGGGLFLLLLASAFAALCLGSHPTSPLAVLESLLDPQHSDIDLIVWELRLPRILLAVLVGAGLAVAGLILQGIVRNPLASPDVIGITGGASLAAVLFLALLGERLGSAWLPAAAMLGAGAVTLLIFVLAWRRGVAPERLVLVGIGIAAALGAVTTLVIVLSDDATAMRAYVWLTGSLYGAQWPDVLGLLPWLLVFIPLAWYQGRQLDALGLGDGVAQGLGIRVAASRALLVLISVVLAGAAVAYAGGLSFVGLIAPHIARRLGGRGFAGNLPLAAMIGGLIVLHADLLGRLAFQPSDLPAGIFVSGIGAPFFIYLLYRTRR